MQYSPNSIENAYIHRQIHELRRDLITELNQFSYKVENYVNTQIRSSHEIHKTNLTSSINNLYERVKSDIVDSIKIESQLLENKNNKLEEQLSSKIFSEVKNNIDTNIKSELDKKIYEQVQKELNYNTNYIVNKEIKKQISLLLENQLAIERKLIKKEYEDRIRFIENSFQDKLDNIVRYNITREKELINNFVSIFESMMQKYINQNHKIYQQSGLIPGQQLTQLQLGIYSQSDYDFVETNEINVVKKEVDTIDKPSSIHHISEFETIKLNSSAPEFVPKYLKK